MNRVEITRYITILLCILKYAYKQQFIFCKNTPTAVYSKCIEREEETKETGKNKRKQMNKTRTMPCGDH